MKIKFIERSSNEEIIEHIKDEGYDKQSFELLAIYSNDEIRRYIIDEYLNDDHADYDDHDRIYEALAKHGNTDIQKSVAELWVSGEHDSVNSNLLEYGSEEVWGLVLQKAEHISLARNIAVRYKEALEDLQGK